MKHLIAYPTTHRILVFMDIFPSPFLFGGSLGIHHDRSWVKRLITSSTQEIGQPSMKRRRISWTKSRRSKTAKSLTHRARDRRRGMNNVSPSMMS